MPTHDLTPTAVMPTHDLTPAALITAHDPTPAALITAHDPTPAATLAGNTGDGRGAQRLPAALPGLCLAPPFWTSCGPRTTPDLTRGHIYLDYTGGGLYAESQLAPPKLLVDAVFGNPHSQNLASRAIGARIKATRAQILAFFRASPEEYQVIFTPNATGALRLVGESYPFGPGGRYLLTFDNHNSVNGIREFARANGAGVSYVPLTPLISGSPTRPCPATAARRPGPPTGAPADGGARPRPPFASRPSPVSPASSTP